jgi:glycosyltransferase involved in cell wall biosynthesis
MLPFMTGSVVIPMCRPRRRIERQYEDRRFLLLRIPVSGGPKSRVVSGVIASAEDIVRIAVLASIAHSVPPRSYGPWEQVASTLTEGLVERGHDVTLFATADSVTAAALHSEARAGYEEDASVDAKVYEALHIAAAFERASEFDIISNQFDFLPLAFSALVSTPVVTTIHGFSSERIVPVYRKYDAVGHYVAISDADRHPDLTYAATIHHGIDIDQFTFGAGDGGYLLFLGRIHPDKGTREAIDVARRSGIPLVIAGIIQDQGYFAKYVAPCIDGVAVTYVGPVGPVQRDQLLGGAIALLHLISFDEPFGLSVVESLAAGTPVIACPRGSMTEIVRPGITGFLANDVEAALEAVTQLNAIDRRDCRADARERFSADRMVADYERLYQSIADQRRD